MSLWSNYNVHQNDYKIRVFIYHLSKFQCLQNEIKHLLLYFEVIIKYIFTIC